MVCLLVVLLLPVLAFAASPAGFEQGNSMYAKGNYKGAIDAYSNLLKEGYTSEALYYNLGNAHYKNGDNAEAVYYFEKAHKLSPGDEDVNINLQFARLKTADKIDQPAQFFLARWWQSLMLGFSLKGLAIFSILCFLAASGALIGYIYTGSVGIKKASFYGSIVLFAIGAFTIVLAKSQSDYFNNTHDAIIFTASVTVKSAPSNAAKNLFILHDGTKVSITGNSAGWTKIKLPNGTEGWIISTDAREI